MKKPETICMKWSSTNLFNNVLNAPNGFQNRDLETRETLTYVP